MALQIGIVGLPNVGKSTLFNVLTKSKGAQAANYPFCTIDPNVGIVEVPDERLSKLTEIVKPEKTIPTVIEFKDIAGLVKGAHKGEGLGNAFLMHIREVDAICHVLRVFDGDVIHVDGTPDARRDRETIEAELVLADLDHLGKRTEKLEGKARSGEKGAKEALETIRILTSTLNDGILAAQAPLSPEQRAIAAGFQLLTMKPMLAALNVSEAQLSSLTLAEAKQRAGLDADTTAIMVCAKLEEELVDLSPEDAVAMLSELSVTSSGLDQLIRSAYDALNLLTFFTAGPKEVRAWTVRKGAKAPEAAGRIHTDFEKGFIRAETIAFDDFVTHGGEQGAKEAGKLRVEGKEYVVKDGDIFHFRFNV